MISFSAYPIKGKRFYLSVALLSISITAMLLLGCASTSRNSIVSADQTASPAWVYNHPTSSTHFIGIGSSRLGGDPVTAQKAACMAALSDIAQQIEVTIISDNKLFERAVTINDKMSINQSVFQKNVQLLARSVLQDWETKATWRDQKGNVYCKVILEKKKYYDRVNKKINDAIEFATDALEASEQGSFDARLRELYRGMIALDDFSGIPLRATVGVKEVVLNSELSRRLQRLLSGVEIHPNIDAVILSAASPVPDTLGVFTTIHGKRDPTVALSWSASTSDVEPTDMPVRADGLHPVSLKSVPSSAGTVRITASLDCGMLTYDLLQRKFMLPSGSFTISRKIPAIFLAENGVFEKKLLDRLTACSAAKAASSQDEADFVLSARSSASGDPVQVMGIYRAKALLNLVFTTVERRRVLDFNEEVSAAGARDCSGAQVNAGKVALEKAVALVKGAY
jgi:LPP20 lipoprotein